MSERVVLALAIGLAVYAVVGFARVPMESLLRDWSCDDSFYYAQVARRLAAGTWSSFDGIERTNGYHPLWLLLQVPVHWLTADHEWAIRLTRVLEVGLALCSFLLLRRVRRRAGMHPVCDLLVLLLLVKTEALYQGMESGVLVAALAATAAALQGHAEYPGRRRGLVLGAALLAAGLARIEAFALAPVVAWLAARPLAPGGPRRAASLTILGVPACGALLYAALNLLAVGSAVPISGVVKALWSAQERGGPPSFASLVVHAQALARLGQVNDGLMYGAIGLLLWLMKRRRPLPAGARALHAFVAAVAFLHVVRFLWFAWTAWPPFASYVHYWVTGRIVRYLVWAQALDLVLRALAARRARRVAAAVVLAVLVASAGSLFRELRHYVRLAADRTPDWEFASLRGARWLNANVREQVGAFDAGVIGWFCDLPVTNLDGLIASSAYVAEVRAGRGDEATAARGIRCIANVVPAATEDFAAFLQWKWSLPRRPRGTFTLLHADADCRPVEAGTPMQFRAYRWDRD